MGEGPACAMMMRNAMPPWNSPSRSAAWIHSTLAAKASPKWPTSPRASGASPARP